MSPEEVLEQYYNKAFVQTKPGQTYPEYWAEVEKLLIQQGIL